MSEQEEWQGPFSDFPWKSQSIAKLAAALSKTQAEIKEAHLDATNPYFNKPYATLSSHWKAARESLSTNGLSVAQTMMPAPRGHICVSTWLLHSSGEWIRSELQLPIEKPGVQGAGSAITYARRYALSAIIGTSPEDDDGNHAQRGEAKGSQPRPPGETPGPPKGRTPQNYPPRQAKEAASKSAGRQGERPIPVGPELANEVTSAVHSGARGVEAAEQMLADAIQATAGGKSVSEKQWRRIWAVANDDRSPRDPWSTGGKRAVADKLHDLGIENGSSLPAVTYDGLIRYFELVGPYGSVSPREEKGE